ncbi:MAG: histidine kinase dimerization/phospho-acceptor domain-containing protein [Gammaproteobacteria bacterium]
MGTPDDQLHQGGTQAPPAGGTPVQAADQYILRDLAAGFAHELNQPLAAIAAYADGAATLLRRDASYSPQALNIVQAIAGQALRAGAVVQQLRGAARALPQKSMPLDPNVLIRTVQPLLEALAAHQEVRLVVELRTPAPAVIGDADRLQALLVLLFGSALDTVTRLPADRRKVTISTDEGNGGTVELSATGPGGTLFQLHLPRVDT